jgi:hypothetical protein
MAGGPRSTRLLVDFAAISAADVFLAQLDSATAQLSANALILERQ